MLISHPHIERAAMGTDGKRSIAKLTGEIEGFSQRLRLRQSQRVLGHLRLDARAHGARRPEEPIRRR